MSAHSLALHRFAVITAGATFVLVFVGGLVTSTGSGLAVPDWPLSFGQVFPPMEGGVLFEHGHRLVASGVGLLMTVLAVWLWRREPRVWVRRLGGIAFAAVVLQGLLGGVTVLLRLPVPVSVAHACLAQAFFGLTVVLAVVTGPRWKTMTATREEDQESAVHRLCLVTTALVYLQLLVGAVMRHTGAGLAIPDFPLAFGRVIPPMMNQGILIHFLHRVGALAVSVCLVWTVIRLITHHRDEPRLLRPAWFAIGLLAAQITLGALTVFTLKAVVPTTAHVTGGAALLATCLILTLRVSRLVAVPTPAIRRSFVTEQVSA